MMVCILAAGMGYNYGRYGQFLHQSLIPIGDLPPISRIIDQFPVDTKLIIAVGIRSQQIIEFLSIAYPDRDIVYQYVDFEENKIVDRGYSLFCCKKYLNGPFIFTFDTTLISSPIPELTHNWVGTSDKKLTEKSILSDSNNKAFDINKNFIGIAGVFDVEQFWDCYINVPFDNDHDSIQTVISNQLLNQKVKLHDLEWINLETLEDIVVARERLACAKVLDKVVDVTYRVDNKIIKFFSNETQVKNRVERGSTLASVIPDILAAGKNFYSYKYIEGRLLSENLDERRWEEFLNWCKENLWKKVPLEENKQKEFSILCNTFYYKKSLNRLEMYFKNRDINNNSDDEDKINGCPSAPVIQLLDLIPGKIYQRKQAYLIHGDLHADNVIETSMMGINRYKLIDWREDFAGELHYGDIYYDLAKLYHTLVFSVEQMKGDKYHIRRLGKSIFIQHMIESHLVNFRDIFLDFCEKNNFDLEIINILNGIIFLNMAPLYSGVLSEYLFYLSKYYLIKYLNKPLND